MTLRPLPPGAIVKVAGVTHRQEDVRTCKVGDTVVIRHDPTNGNDPNACAVETANGRLLGYVPRAGSLNERLVAGHPNGRWSGEIDEVLTGDVWGLRVRVGALVDTTTPAPPGQSNTGIRADVELSDDGQTPRLAEPAGDDTAGGERKVYASSNRLLGTLVGVEGGKVVVRKPGGGEVAYPQAVVRIV